MKQQHVVELSGCNADGDQVSTQQASSVTHFKSPQFIVKPVTNNKQDFVVIISSKGQYRIPFDKSLNIYKGLCAGIKVHVSLKKIVGKLIYWG